VFDVLESNLPLIDMGKGLEESSGQD
jgi:hypothetical protein